MNLKSVVVIVWIAASAALVACGKQSSAPQTSNAEADSQLFKLAQMNGCFECHNISTTTVGPSWMAIAERYKDAPHAETKALLITSVIKGSKGKWLTWKGGDGMPPLGRRVAHQDIEQLVDFILSLKH